MDQVQGVTCRNACGPGLHGAVRRGSEELAWGLEAWSSSLGVGGNPVCGKGKPILKVRVICTQIHKKGNNPYPEGLHHTWKKQKKSPPQQGSEQMLQGGPYPAVVTLPASQGLSHAHWPLWAGPAQVKVPEAWFCL